MSDGDDFMSGFGQMESSEEDTKKKKEEPKKE